MPSTLEGVAQLLRQLDALKRLEDGKALRRSVKSGINEVYKRAHEIIPVGTLIHRTKTTARQRKFEIRGYTVPPGFARQSLRTITTINADKNIASGILSVRKAAYYAVKFLEFGTRKMKAQPWIRRALIEARDNAELALRHSLEVSIEKAAKTR